MGRCAGISYDLPPPPKLSKAWRCLDHDFYDLLVRNRARTAPFGQCMGGRFRKAEQAGYRDEEANLLDSKRPPGKPKRKTRKTYAYQ